ncbi:DUF4185 domain-containing protein [Mycolicibacterium brisbanense]|uniref:DUF4185 domain-containing protein n=1 Tax=Mycolicibacterium brisbanense TaxID=146020 RepID=A0A124DZR6_9MYCO|nr:DUF4185 domain-containing protein [Mycolicibacterium brisbanense]MCV7161019.1 DUF4185 domain-containing protein [Mycolicibacterium brisbanense]GAS88203.1 uncharacterized protein RMCB_2299 [Mycolicibacterium brisbanense]
MAAKQTEKAGARGGRSPVKKAVKTARPKPAKPAVPAPKSGVLPPRFKQMVAAAAEAMVSDLPQPAPGEVINLGPIAGTGTPTGVIGAGGTDLCEIAPSGQVALAGDTFAGQGVGIGEWSRSMGLHVRPGSLNSAHIEFDFAFGKSSTLYAETWPHVDGGSQLPAGTVQVFGIDYALVTRTANLIPSDTRLVRINATQGCWASVPGSWRAADWQSGNQTQISGYQDGNWVYIIADGFARDHQLWLYRCPATAFTDRNTWHAWGMIGDGPDWGWDQAPSPLNSDLFGEVSLRLIEGKAVLTGFNATTLCVEARVADDVTQVAAPWTPMTTIATQDSVAQNYGGYIVPGSTLDQMVILVSQWHTATGNPYRVLQFVANLNR